MKKRVKAGTSKVLRAALLRKAHAAAVLCLTLGLQPPALGVEEQTALVRLVQGRIAEGCFPEQRMIGRVLLEWAVPSWRLMAPEMIGELAERDSPEARAWRIAVLGRDGQSCRACGAGEQLHAHHIIPWVLVPALRLEVANGVTLCEACHVEQHRDMRRLVWQSV